jgi:hypothetical protein
MNGFRSDDDLGLVNDRIHAMHVDAARQRLVRQAAVPTQPAAPHRAIAAALGWSRRVVHGRPASVVGR